MRMEFADFALLITINGYNKWKKFVADNNISLEYDLLDNDTGESFYY